MSEINLDDAKINVEGQWLSAEDLTRMIQEKMDAGDMKIANLAAALEELNTAIENSHTIEVKLAISKQDYEKLIQLGGEDEREAVRKATLAFIAGTGAAETFAEAPAAEQTAEAKAKKKVVIKCSKCSSPIEIEVGERPKEVKCPSCGTTGRLKTKEK